MLPLEGELWEMFERLWRERTFRTRRGAGVSDYVFHRKGKPVDATTFAEEWRAARTVAGVASRIFHDYRRTAARNMIRSGVGQSVAMAITGHRTDSMF